MSTKFHLNMSTTFWDILHTDRQTGENITSTTEGGCRLCIHPCLFVCLWAGYLRLWTDLDETCWTVWVCDKDKLIRFWWRSGYEDYFIFKVVLHHWKIGPKTIHSMIFQNCIGPYMFSWIRHCVVEVSALLVLYESVVLSKACANYRRGDPRWL